MLQNLAMNVDVNTIELLKLLLPLIVFQFGLALFCVVMIWKKGVRNLSPVIWTMIVLLINLLGPIAFLIFGRKRWQDDNY